MQAQTTSTTLQHIGINQPVDEKLRTQRRVIDQQAVGSPTSFCPVGNDTRGDPAAQPAVQRINSQDTNSEVNLNCLLLNARSLYNKLPALHNLLYTNSYKRRL